MVLGIKSKHRLIFVRNREEGHTANRLRTGHRENWKQAGALGYGSAHVRGLYRAQGCPPFRARSISVALLMLGVRNPLLPTAVTKMPTRLWLRLVAAHLGLVRGGRRYGSLAW